MHALNVFTVLKMILDILNRIQYAIFTTVLRSVEFICKTKSGVNNFRKNVPFSKQQDKECC